MEIRFFKRSERQLMLDTIDRLWRHNYIYVRNPAVLEHFCLNTPYRAEFVGEDNYSCIGMWDDDGDVVGFLGFIPTRFNVFGKEYPSATSTIWFVDKAKQRQSKKSIDGTRWTEALTKEILAMYGLGLYEGSYRIAEANGNYMLPDLPRWLTVNRKEPVLKHLLPPGTNTLVLPDARSINYDGSLKISVDEFDPARWDRYYFKTFAPMSIGAQRDARFLQWRYGESPVLKYKLVTVENVEGEYEGLAIFRREPILDDQFALGRIVEFISVKSEAAIALGDAVLRTFPDVIAWDFYCMSGITAYGLESVGFQRVPLWMDQGLLPTRCHPIEFDRLSIRCTVWLNDKLRQEIEQMTDVPWYLTRGDADQDRAN